MNAGSHGMHFGEERSAQHYGGAHGGSSYGGLSQKQGQGSDPAMGMQWGMGKYGGGHGTDLDAVGYPAADSMGLDMMQMENTHLDRRCVWCPRLTADSIYALHFIPNRRNIVDIVALFPTNMA
jgi:hypothetical protein